MDNQMSTKWILTLMAWIVVGCCASGCANRFQHAADKSLLIQENLQLDQALSITQYELMLTQQENDALRRQLEQVSQNRGGSTSSNTSDNMSSGRIPPLRSEYEPMGMRPNFNANDPNLPPPSNQMPQRFQRPQQNPSPDFPPQSATVPGNQSQVNRSSVIQASRVQNVEVPPGAPQWSPYRDR
jgi:hypothetical protein